MPKMRATSRMPRGVLNRYRTRMLTAEGDTNTFEERSPKWRNFYAQQGWAHAVPDEPAPAPRRRGRPARAETKPEPEPEPEPVSAKADEYDLESLTNEQLRERAEQCGHELPAGYVKNDDLIAMIRGTE